MRSLRWLGALTVLVAYALTMSRDVALFDSPELALVAVELGLGHPPGQPLHTMLGFVFSHLPGVPSLIGLNFMSALAGALTVVPVARIAERMCDTLSPRNQRLMISVVVVGALHPVLWEPATRIEVYSLATLLAVCALERVQTALVHAERVQTALVHAEKTSRVHPLIVAALWMGLAASANPVTAIACTLCVTPSLIRALWRRELAMRVLGASCVAGLLGLMPYLYVLMIADKTDALVWGAPTTRDTLISYFSGADYARNTGITLDAWLDHVTQLARASTPLSLPLAVGLLVALVRPITGLGRWAPLLLGVTCAGLVAANHVFVVDNPDYNGYLAAAAWLGLAVLAGFVVALDQQDRHGPALTLALSLFTFATLFTFMSSSRADDHLTRSIVADALQAAPHDALVVVESDHWIAPALYLQRVEKLRPDVVVVGAGLASSGWYWDLLYRAHPTLAPFELRGAGGRDARLRRFIARQAARPLLLETLGLGGRLNVRACVAGALLHARDCVNDATAAHAFANKLAALFRAADHIPLGRELLASIALRRGEDLWHMNAPSVALHTLLATADVSHGDAKVDWARVHVTPALGRPARTWQRRRVLGDPARSAFVAAELLFAGNQRDAAQRLLDSARHAGLAEAQ